MYLFRCFFSFFFFFFFLFSLFGFSSISVASSIFVTIVVHHHHRCRPSLLAFCYPAATLTAAFPLFGRFPPHCFGLVRLPLCLLVVGLASVELAVYLAVVSLCRSFIRLSVRFDSSSVCFSRRRPVRLSNRSGRWFGRCLAVSILVVVRRRPFVQSGRLRFDVVRPL